MLEYIIVTAAAITIGLFVALMAYELVNYKLMTSKKFMDKMMDCACNAVERSIPKVFEMASRMEKEANEKFGNGAG